MLKSILATLWPFGRARPADENIILLCPRCGGPWRSMGRSIHHNSERRVTYHARWSCRQCGRTYEEWETAVLREERSGYAFT